MTLYAEHNPNRKQDTDENRAAKEKITTPEEEKFSKNLLERMLSFLNAGYKISKINSFENNGLYTTELAFGEKIEVFNHTFPINVLLNTTDKEAQLISFLKEMVEKKSK